MSGAADIWGLVAEWTTPAELVHAVEQARAAGYRHLDAYTPMPVHGLHEAMGERRSRLPWVTFIGGLLGGVGGFFLQYWISAVDYAVNVGGRPTNSWPAFIPVTFECAVLVAGVATTIAFFASCRLPRPYHPIFNADGFERASVDRFFLCIEAADPHFDIEQTRVFLEELQPHAVRSVEA